MVYRDKLRWRARDLETYNFMGKMEHVASGPYFCSVHGPNPSHNTLACNQLSREFEDSATNFNFLGAPVFDSNVAAGDGRAFSAYQTNLTILDTLALINNSAGGCGDCTVCADGYAPGTVYDCREYFGSSMDSSGGVAAAAITVVFLVVVVALSDLLRVLDRSGNSKQSTAGGTRATIAPAVVLAALGATFLVARRRNAGSALAVRAVRHKHLSAALFVLFLVYSLVSFTVVQTKSRRDGMAHLEPLSDLRGAHKPSRSYYKFVECGRRIMLTGAAVFILPDSAAQIAIVLLLAVVFLFASESLSPFGKEIDMGLSRWCNGVILASMYVALLLKVDLSNEGTGSLSVFVGVLIAANVFMVVCVIVQSVFLIMEYLSSVRESADPLSRSMTSGWHEDEGGDGEAAGAWEGGCFQAILADNDS
eukprot:g6212.t1